MNNNTANTSNESFVASSARQPKGGPISTLLAWWYRHFAPIEPPATASLSQREEARRGKLASITTLFFMLFLIILLIVSALEKNYSQMLMAFIGGNICAVSLFINRKGYVKVAGLIMLGLIYIGGTQAIINYPIGLSAADLPRLGLTIIPDMLVLGYFSSNSLFLVSLINFVQTLGILLWAPHDSTITNLLQTSPGEIFLNIYVLQLITAVILYVWARSLEEAIARADRAEEVVTFERHEKERQELELEQRRHLDDGIQEILRTHVAVANGDLTARAPLHQTHTLWQIANALNTLIARLQSVSQSELEMRQIIMKERRRNADPIPQGDQYKVTDPRIARVTKIDELKPKTQR